jgi:hypothetical protein
VPWIVAGEGDLLFDALAMIVLWEAGVDVGPGVAFRDHELLRYEAGSFFAAHADRVRGEGHVGTLLLVAPTAGTAGGTAGARSSGGLRTRTGRCRRT